MASTNQRSLVEVSCTSLGKYSAKTNDNEYLGAGWRSGESSTSHLCGPGSIPRLGVICGLSLLVLYSAPRGFSAGPSIFPSLQKPTFYCDSAPALERLAT